MTPPLITVESPFYLLWLVEHMRQTSKDKRPVSPPFEQYLAWRYHVRIPEQSANEMLAIVRGAFA